MARLRGRRAGFRGRGQESLGREGGVQTSRRCLSPWAAWRRDPCPSKKKSGRYVSGRSPLPGQPQMAPESPVLGPGDRAAQTAPSSRTGSSSPRPPALRLQVPTPEHLSECHTGQRGPRHSPAVCTGAVGTLETPEVLVSSEQKGKHGLHPPLTLAPDAGRAGQVSITVTSV